jgi:starch phosphorylase
MKPVRVFTVIPALPGPLEPLRDLAYNLGWCWNHDAIELFRRLDRDLWESSGHNPIRMLGTVNQAQLEDAARDPAFLAHMERVAAEFREPNRLQSCWFDRTYPNGRPLIAYFSAEFGITECLSIYAGGLGLLAGDHLKSSSDLGLPLVGVGLLYQQGYFRQYLNQTGWQQEAYEDNDFHNLPIRPCKNGGGEQLTVSVDFPGHPVQARVWLAQVGRVPLYLLDTNFAANERPEDRDLTNQLYGGDLEVRVRQEILLGIGGYRALRAAGVNATTFHMNEGHSAFLSLEHVRHLIDTRKLTFRQARELATTSLVFTTHTPVEAGHDYFPSDLLQRYFGNYVPKLGISWQEFLGLGRRNPSDENELFCMTILALRLAIFSNGVSRLHGEVSRRMWKPIWPGVPIEEIPVGHVTNGVHFRSWISAEMNSLFDRYLGPGWRQEPADRQLWQRVEKIPAEELWRTHERRRERLVSFVRRRLQEQLRQRGAPPSQIQQAEEVLDSEALTIGFARRFATYKRGTLLLRDVDRLARILSDSDRPVQVIFAGKAHPRDQEGKELIRQIVNLSNRSEFRHRVVFLENYDLDVARALVQGVDVWLNTPRRPLEASGTSGMKAAANGVLNMSTLDGWWAEAWEASGNGAIPIGWAIGNGETYADTEYQNQVEAEALYGLLEHDVVPTFYDRDVNRLPRRWIKRMKASLSMLCAYFNPNSEDEI